MTGNIFHSEKRKEKKLGHSTKDFDLPFSLSLFSCCIRNLFINNSLLSRIKQLQGVYNILPLPHTACLPCTLTAKQLFKPPHPTNNSSNSISEVHNFTQAAILISSKFRHHCTVVFDSPSHAVAG